MAAIKDQNTVHANRCRIVIDGVVLAEGQGVTIQESGGTQAVRTISTEYAHEHVHNAYDCSVTINALRFKKSAMKKLNVGNGPLVDLPTFLLNAYDDLSGGTLAKVKDCTSASRSLSINANQPVQRNIQAMGIKVTE